MTQEIEKAFLRGVVARTEVEPEPDYTAGKLTPLPPQVRRYIALVQLAEIELSEKNSAGAHAEGLQLSLKIQELRGAQQLAMWQHCLCQNYGLTVGRKLANCEIEVGMKVEHVGAIFGEPDTLQELPGGGCLMSYGPQKGGGQYIAKQLVITQVLVAGRAYLLPSELT